MRVFRPSWKVTLVAAVSTVAFFSIHFDEKWRLDEQVRNATSPMEILAIRYNAGLNIPYMEAGALFVLVCWIVFVVNGIVRARDIRKGLSVDKNPISLGKL